MSYAADDYESIRRRAEEIKAERNLALTGSTLEETKVQESVGEYATGWATAFTGVATGGTSTTTLTIGQLPPYTPQDYDPA